MKIVCIKLPKILSAIVLKISSLFKKKETSRNDKKG